jgi:hypothetical protein
LKEGHERIRVLITVKTYPIPSKKYDELVCTAGVKEDGEFVRLYPINFRELDFSQQYKKYQWVEVDVEKHVGRDFRKESYRPDGDSLENLGVIKTCKGGDWSDRAEYALAKASQSMEDLREQQERDCTSLGIFKPKIVHDLIIEPDDPEWSPRFLAELSQRRLFETRKATLQPPRKVPFKFKYKFECEDSRCKGHRMMIEDWEVGALYWRMVDQGNTPQEAAQIVRRKFLEELCGEDKETFFYVGTVLAYPKSWVVIGLFYPKRGTLGCGKQQSLF